MATDSLWRGYCQIEIFFLALLTLLMSRLTNGEKKGVWRLHTIPMNKYPKATCLDGSPGAFWFLQGSGEGLSSFVIFHEGGGWCERPEYCLGRSYSYLGSSTTWARKADCSDLTTWTQPCNLGSQGLISHDSDINPVMHNWNKVYLGYCDGGSFTGTREDALPVYDEKLMKLQHIYMRGRYILDAAYDMLITKFKLNQAHRVVIGGSSAGGLSVFTHIDSLSKLIRDAASARKTPPPQVVGVADAGYFMDLPSIGGQYLLRELFQKVVYLHYSEPSFDYNCMRYHHKKGPSQSVRCFFPQYILPFIQTPLFISNSLTDIWQTEFVMRINCNVNPKRSNATCTKSQIDYLNNFRDSIVNSMSSVLLSNKNHGGVWMLQCNAHSMINDDKYWLHSYIQNKNLGETFLSWLLRDDDAPAYRLVDGLLGSNSCKGTSEGHNKTFFSIPIS